MLDKFLLVGFPYAALFVAVAVAAIRYYHKPFSVSSLSSQFLENQQLFWGSNLWHWGILGVLLGHLAGFLMPRQILAWNAQPVRLFILEATGLILALLALVGVLALLARRLTSARARAVTSKMDIALLLLLCFQVLTGLDIALRLRWGSSWFAASAAPYLWSIVTFRPRPEFLLTMPWSVKLHVLSAFTLILLLPFSRLIHFLVVPLHYYFRAPQLVIWNRRPSAAR